MRLTWLGWAGVLLEAEGEALVIDPLADPRPVFGAFRERAAGTPLPEIVAASPGIASAGLVTHLHRDHADAAALTAALRPGAPVLHPHPGGGGPIEEAGLAQAEAELSASGLERRLVAAWDTTEIGPFQITALPAADGTGDPQVSWAIEAGGVRVIHLGDTTYHGSWWRMALRAGPFDVALLPINGAVMHFPHRRPASPLPGVMDPRQAAIAAKLLGARLAIPIHHSGYDIAGLYDPAPDAATRFLEEAAVHGVERRELAAGERIDVEPLEVTGGAATGVAAQSPAAGGVDR